MARGTREPFEDRRRSDDDESQRRFEMPPAKDEQSDIDPDKTYEIRGNGKSNHLRQDKTYEVPGSMAAHFLQLGIAVIIREIEK
jgi:hypothetical protein